MNTAKFFDQLKEVCSKTEYPASRIFNVDEVELTDYSVKSSRVWNLEERNQVAPHESESGLILTTAVLCMSASGVYVPPMLTFPSVEENTDLGEGAPKGSVLAFNPSGWMKLELFRKWLDHFIEHVKPAPGAPVLLIIDGHLMHTRNFEILKLCDENHIRLLLVPPVCGHLHPLEVSLLNLINMNYIRDVFASSQTTTVTMENVAYFFGRSYEAVATTDEATSSFRRTGIFPLNPAVVTPRVSRKKESASNEFSNLLTWDDVATQQSQNIIPDLNLDAKH